jgi:hypothetical protein
MRRKEAASSAILGGGGGEEQAEGFIHSKRDERGGPLARPRDAGMEESYGPTRLALQGWKRDAVKVFCSWRRAGVAVVAMTLNAFFVVF